MKMVKIFSPLVILMVLLSCTKSEGPNNSTSASLVTPTSGDPQRTVFEAELSLPKKMEKMVKPTDMLIWTLRDQNSEVLAGVIGPAPSFPHSIKVEARQLLRPVTESESLFFDARIVKSGNEGKPPQKGELQITAGAPAIAQPLVENPDVDQKQLEAFLKKHNLPLPETLKLGGKLKAEFGPATL
jgi:hypothetical protein